MMGGSLAHEFMVLNEPARTRSSCATPATTRPTSRSRRVAKPEPAAGGALAHRGGGDARDATTIAAAGRVARASAPTAPPRPTFFVTGDGRLITAMVRGDFEVNETKLANVVQAVGGLRTGHRRGDQAAGMVPGYASPIGAHGTTVVVDELVGALAEPGGRRQPAGLPPAQRQRRARLHARTWWPTSSMPARATPARTAATPLRPAPGHRGRQHLQAGHRLHREARARRSWPRTAAATRDLWAATGSASGGRWPASWRRTTTSKGIVWPEAVAPYAVQLVALGAGKDPAVARRPKGSTSA